MKNNIILFGFKGSGKTYFGRLLSQATGHSFIDTDDLIEEIYETENQEKYSCRQIAQKIGEDGFRALEKRVIFSIEGIEKTIISVGGGAVLDVKNYQRLKALGTLVYLDVKKELLKERMLQSGIPSFLDPSDLEGSFERMYNERKVIYERLYKIKIDTHEKTDWQVIKKITSYL